MTKPLKKKSKEFKSKYTHEHVGIIPFFILSGLKETKVDRDTYALAENFMTGTEPDDYEKVASELWDIADHFSIGNYPAEKVMDILYSGSEKFENYKPYHSFYEKNNGLLKVYSPSFITLNRYFLSGANDLNWYSETMAAFKKYLVGYDIELFAKIFAITSPMTHFHSNLVLALRAYDLFQKNKKFRGEEFMYSVQIMLEDLRNKKLDFKRNCRGRRRKVINFANALLGDKNAVVVDSRIMGAYGLSQMYVWREKIMTFSPRRSEYDLIEEHIKALAEACEYEPRQIVSMFWCGTRRMESKFKTTNAEKLLKEVLK